MTEIDETTAWEYYPCSTYPVLDPVPHQGRLMSRVSRPTCGIVPHYQTVKPGSAGSRRCTRADILLNVHLFPLKLQRKIRMTPELSGNRGAITAVVSRRKDSEKRLFNGYGQRFNIRAYRRE